MISFDVTAFILSAIAILLSLASFRTSHQALLERRHSDLVSLRAEYLKKFKNMKSRIANVLMYLELAKSEANSFKEGNIKKNTLDKVDEQLNGFRVLKENTDLAIKKFEELNMKNNNKSKSLIELQEYRVVLDSTESEIIERENDVLMFVNGVLHLKRF